MLYRRMPKVPKDLSILGFGCMRLPETESGLIEESLSTEMIRYAIDNGVNYFDTAYPYHNGQSEPFLGRALQNGYREKVSVATKLPSWLVKSREDMDRYLNEQLDRLDTDYIDFYLLHGLSRHFWDGLLRFKVLDFLDSALEDGRIKYAGFSFHDDVAVFKEIVDSYDWSFCQIQYNFMDEMNQAGTEGLKYAADKKLGIVVMEPLRGGMLAKEIMQIEEIWKKSNFQRSPAERALQWVWNHPEVTVVLSGMSSMDQLIQNVHYAENGHAGSLLPRDLDLFRDVENEYKARTKVPCTGCRYCMPCPSSVGIPECFEMYNQACMFDSPDIARLNYNIVLGGLFGPKGFASLCKECKECEKKCPQAILISENLKVVAKYFGQ